VLVAQAVLAETELRGQIRFLEMLLLWVEVVTAPRAVLVVGRKVIVPHPEQVQRVKVIRAATAQITFLVAVAVEQVLLAALHQRGFLQMVVRV
jgi:hypothetical protein